MRRITRQGETGMLCEAFNNNFCIGTNYIKLEYFSLFLGRHTHNKTLSCQTIEGWADLAIILLKSTTQVVFIYFTYH